MGSPNKEWGKFMWASIGSFPAYFVKWNPKKIQLKKNAMWFSVSNIKGNKIMYVFCVWLYIFAKRYKEGINQN